MGERLKAYDLEIVGFNGQPLTACGRSLPIARRLSDGMHCVLRLVDDAERLDWRPESEALEFASEGRWTPLEVPTCIPAWCATDRLGQALTSQPMALFTSREFRDSLVAPAAGSWRFWKPVRDDAGIMVFVGTEGATQLVTDDWSRVLLAMFDEGYRGNASDEELNRLLRFLLCCARSDALRWQAFLRYMLIRDEPLWRRAFNLFHMYEFPGATWESAKAEARELDGRLKV